MAGSAVIVLGDAAANLHPARRAYCVGMATGGGTARGSIGYVSIMAGGVMIRLPATTMTGGAVTAVSGHAGRKGRCLQAAVGKVTVTTSTCVLAAVVVMDISGGSQER